MNAGFVVFILGISALVARSTLLFWRLFSSYETGLMKCTKSRVNIFESGEGKVLQGVTALHLRLLG